MRFLKILTAICMSALLTNGIDSQPLEKDNPLEQEQEAVMARYHHLKQLAELPVEELSKQEEG